MSLHKACCMKLIISSHNPGRGSLGYHAGSIRNYSMSLNYGSFQHDTPLCPKQCMLVWFMTIIKNRRFALSTSP